MNKSQKDSEAADQAKEHENYIAALLDSEDPAEQVRGLERATEEPSYRFLPQAMYLVHRNHPDISDYARRVSVYLAETYLMDPRLRVGGLRLLWARLAIKKYSPDFLTRAYQNLQARDPAVIIAGLCGVRHFINKEESLRILSHFINHPNDRVRATACTQIGFRASRASSGVLMELIQDCDDRVVANVIEMMEQGGNPEFVPFVTRFRYHRNNRVRANALKALYFMSDLDLTEDFEGMLKHQQSLMRTSAVWAIGEIGRQDLRYSKLLKLVVNDPDELLQRNLITACEKACDLRKLKFLKQALFKNHPRLKEDAAFAAWHGDKAPKKPKKKKPALEPAPELDIEAEPVAGTAPEGAAQAERASEEKPEADVELTPQVEPDSAEKTLPDNSALQ